MCKRILLWLALVATSIGSQAMPIHMSICIDRAFDSSLASVSAVDPIGNIFSLTSEPLKGGRCGAFEVDSDKLDSQYHLQLTFAESEQLRKTSLSATYCSKQVYVLNHLPEWTILIDADVSGFERGICGG